MFSSTPPLLARALLLGLAGFFLCQGATSYQATFDYDYTNVVTCSTTGAAVVTNCLDHFEVGIIQASGALIVLTNVPAANPSPGTPIHAISSAVFPVAGFGQVPLYAVAVGKDAAGNPSRSSPQQCVFNLNVTPAPPAVLTVNPATAVTAASPGHP